MRADPLTPALRVRELLETLHEGNVARAEHGYVPLVKIQAQCALPAGASLFDSLLVFQNYPMEQAVERGEQ